MPSSKTIAFLAYVVVASLSSYTLFAQASSGTNYDESKVQPYTLPDPLQMQDGKKITTAKEWTNVQRPYIYHLFEENVYGRVPQIKIPLTFRVMESSDDALDGAARRKQVRIYVKPSDTSAFIDVLIYLPKNKSKSAVFLGYNFIGNQTVQSDKAIFISGKPALFSRYKNADGTATDSSRGTDKSWDIQAMIKNGIGLATAYYGDIEVDTKDGWETGIRTKLKDELKIQPQEWSAISAWAWGLSRIMDYIEQDKDIDAKHVALFGHSRLGKTALWAGATDLRFSIVISNESGEGGAALTKRNFGETTKDLNERFPHWFVEKYKTYNNNAATLPLDQHMLLALIAPRPLYVASAEGDQWSDPKGEFLSAVNAAPVYALFNKKGLGTDVMPPLNTSVGNTIRYHERTGKHDVTEFDWKQYIKFVKEEWK